MDSKTLVKPLTTLRMSAFVVEVALADNFVCGGVNGAFRVTVELAARELTPEGFVTEVQAFMLDVKRAFAAGGEDSCDAPHRPNGMLKASCEELAGGVVHVAHKNTGARLEHAIVEVQNLTGWVKVEWNRGEEVPSFPRTATKKEQDATRRARERADYNRNHC